MIENRESEKEKERWIDYVIYWEKGIFFFFFLFDCWFIFLC